mgnify:CR=1 FL=1
MKATLTFPTQETAKSFATAWACNTLKGHDMSAKKEDGSFDVTVYDVDDAKKYLLSLMWRVCE